MNVGKFTISTSDHTLVAHVLSKVPDVTYQTIPSIFGEKVEITYVFPRNAEVEQAIEKFAGDKNTQIFLQKLREVKHEMMNLVRTTKAANRGGLHSSHGGHMTDKIISETEKLDGLVPGEGRRKQDNDDPLRPKEELDGLVPGEGRRKLDEDGSDFLRPKEEE